MDCLKKYRVYCTHENAHIETWKFTKPTTCPNDSRHAIDESQTIELEKKYIENENMQHVYINAKSFQNTNGYYMIEGRTFDIPNGNNNFTSDVVLPIPQCMYGIKIMTMEEHVDDCFSIIINPDTLLGVVTAAADVGTTVVNVSSTVTSNVIPGFYISLSGMMYMIVAKDQDNNTVTLNSPLTTQVDPMTHVLLNVYIIKDYRIQGAGALDVGYGTMGGKLLTTGTVIRLIYKNTDCLAKKFSINTEFTY